MMCLGRREGTQHMCRRCVMVIHINSFSLLSILFIHPPLSPPSTPGMTPTLPSEILLWICKELDPANTSDRRTLALVARSSRTLYDLAMPTLYNALILDNEASSTFSRAAASSPAMTLNIPPSWPPKTQALRRKPAQLMTGATSPPRANDGASR